MKVVAVTGATGTIGQAVVRALLERGDDPIVLSRDPDRARDLFGDVDAFRWADPKAEPAPAEALKEADAVIHLLGEPIAQRWTDAAKKEIRDSRVLGTRNLVAAMRKAGPRLRTLISQSGVDIYARGPEPRTEDGAAADHFLADVVRAWEAEAREAEEDGVRIVLTRTGPVLSAEGGALAKMMPFFKAGVGGPVAGGKQPFSWIHLDDVVGALLFALDNEEVEGPLNVTAPRPASNKELSKALGRAIGRPAFLPVPGFAVKVLYGEMATIVTDGPRVVPKKLEDLGYEFRHTDLDAALRDATA